MIKLSFIEDEHEVNEILRRVTCYFLMIGFDNLSYGAKELAEASKKLQKEVQRI